jgi:hypothetical protein
LHEVQNQEQTQELRISDGMPDLGRILGTWGQVILRSKEWRGSQVSISGGIMAFILYTPEDGSEPRTLESWIPFQMKWELEDDQRDGDIRIHGLMRFLDARSVSARKIMLRCGVSVMAQAFCGSRGEIAAPVQLPEDVQVLKKRYPVRFPRLAGEKPFQLDEELPLPAASGSAKTLVSYTLEPQVSECRVVSGRVVFRGTCGVHLVYANEAGRLGSADLEVPFSQLAELEEQLSADARCDLRMAVTSLEVDISGEDKLHLKAGLLAQYLIDDREMVELITDAYSPHRNVELKLGELELPQILDRQQVSVPVQQSLRQNAAEIADVTYLPDFPEIRRRENVQVELPGQFQVLWYDEKGMLQSSIARTEENWDTPAGEDTRMEATVLPGSLPTATAGSGMELRGESILDFVTTARSGLPMVTGLTLGDERTGEGVRPSLILRRAGDATLWEIAKSTDSTVAAIRTANALETEPAPDRILLIPVS